MMRGLQRAVGGMLLAVVPSIGSAQRARAVRPSGIVAFEASPAVPALNRVVPAPQRADDGHSVIGSTFRSVVGVASGAVVGGWLGYFMSQVGRSDWDALPSDQKNSLRHNYTVTGAGLGAVTGFFMRPRRPPRLEGLAQPEGVPFRTGRLLLTAKELHRSVATTALEAVEMERPDWISSLRYDQRNGQAGPADASAEMASVAVYVGDVQVGRLETLRDMSIPEVAELRFYSARDARKRWGVEHKYGAIEVVPISADAAAPAPGN